MVSNSRLCLKSTTMTNQKNENIDENNRNIKEVVNSFINYRLLTNDMEMISKICGCDVEDHRERWNEERIKSVFIRLDNYVQENYSLGVEYFTREFERCVKLITQERFYGNMRSNKFVFAKKLFLWKNVCTVSLENYTKEGLEVKRSDVDLDDEMCKMIYDRDAEVEYYDTELLMLMTFGIVKPKLKQDREVTPGRNEKFRDMLDDLCSIIPQSLLFDEIPHVKSFYNKVESAIGENRNLSILDMWKMLVDIGGALEINTSLQNLKELQRDYDIIGYSLPGIFVDDVKDDEQRVWIFPDDNSMALCCRIIDDKLEIKPYEMIFYQGRILTDDEYCCFISATGEESILLGNKIALDNDISFADFSFKFDENDEICEISLTPRSSGFANKFPYRRFKRTSTDDVLNQKVKMLLNDANQKGKSKYEKIDGHYKSKVVCHDERLFNHVSVLIGIDLKNIYLCDIKELPGLVLREDCKNAESFLFSRMKEIELPSMKDMHKSKYDILCIPKDECEEAGLIGIDDSVYIYRSKPSKMDGRYVDRIVFGALSRSIVFRCQDEEFKERKILSYETIIKH